MPIYEYKCKECHSRFEELVKVNSEDPICPHCKSDETEKQLSKIADSSKNSCAGHCHHCSSCQ
ncbi:hypothetical protein A3F08_01545 [Candidatus Berkelbacteria bacterium RIFCSPHIGHO2_12_FULL_36_9]|uniref:Putative regulatory protein FmdB zinc ribbon domain-containing protein n=1 Tax=Candidatus Berkelbacteria bacterium RIFCSPHIGHO2_12_FULL_36_9 TaxID=1797469 RepID=A0A1F5EKA0_9BACT|nr:MAG: hypothetical protein A3F08_01545 [Candidatus Berkelbacteria bacterium RIFCSPHIGHO2_12_FULL_36_9]